MPIYTTEGREFSDMVIVQRRLYLRKYAKPRCPRCNETRPLRISLVEWGALEDCRMAL